MATSNNRDVRLGIEIETAGEESVKRLASAVRALGKEGDPAALEYERLANELDRLSQQAGAVQSLQVLRTEVEQLGLAERDATTAARLATAQYAEQALATNALRDAQTAARVAAAQAKTSYDDLKLAFQTLKNEGKAAAESQDVFNAKLREARQQVDEQNRALKARRDELTESNRLVREATKAENELAREADASSKAARGTVAALQAQAAALAQVEASAVALGAETSDLNAAEARLLATTQAYVAEVGSKRAAVAREQAEADHLAAVEALALAEAQQRASVAAASELASIRDSEQFTKQYTAAKAAAAAETLRLAEAEETRLTRLRAQIEAEHLASLETHGLADARERARIAAQSELAAIKDSEEFTKRYAQAQRDAAAAVLAVAEADERASRAARDFAASEAAAIAEFNKAAEAARITNFWANEINRLDAEAEQAAVATRRLAEAGEAVTKAFGQTGVRSLQAIRGEMTGVGEALTLLNRQFANGSIGADDLARATSSAQVRLATLRKELQTIPALPNVFEKINSSINDLISRFGSLTAAVATVGFAVKPVLDAALAFDSLRRVLTVTTGSAEAAAQQIEFLRTTANTAGLSAGQLASSFSLFEASLLKSGIPLKATQELFGGVAAAAGTLGLSTDRVNGILLALGQVANKGKVSLEELQGQIGEALPGALKLSADALGVTTAQLSAMLKSGTLLAEDFLPAFARQLNTTFGQGTKPVEGLAQAFNRLKNAATETSAKIVDTSAYRGLTSVLDGLAKNFDTVIAASVSVGKAFLAFKAIDIAREFFGIKAAAELAAASKLKDAEATAVQTAATVKAAAAIEAETVALNVNTAARARNATASTFAGGALGALTTGFAKTAEAAAGVTTKIGSLVSSLGGPYGVALGLAVTFSDQLGNAIARVAARISGSLGTIEKFEEAMKKEAEAAKKAAEAQQLRQELISESFAKIQVTYDKDITATEKLVQNSALLTKAKKEEGAAAINVAELTGNEATAKQAAATASANNAAAIANEAAARQSEVNLLEAERAALVRAAGAQSTWSESRKQFFVDFDANLAKKKAELEVTKQQAEAEATAADKARLAAEAYRDNSESIGELLKSVADLSEKYNQLIQGFKDGVVTQAQLDAGARKLAAAQGLLKDAYEDATKALVRRSAALKESAAATQQDIDLQRAKINVDLRIADLSGQYADKLNQQIKLKNLDLDASRAKIKASTEEAAILTETARLMQEQLRLGDPLYEQKKREIDATLAAAKAKANEGAIEQENLRGLNAELGILNGTLYKAAAGFDAFGDSARNAAFDAKKAADDIKSAQDRIALGEIFSKGYNSSPETLKRKAADGTLTKDDLAAAQENFSNAQANLSQAQRNGTSISSAGFQSLLAEYNQARAILDQLSSPTIGAGSRLPGDGSGSGQSLYGPGAKSNSPFSPAVIHQVQITVPGKATEIVNTTSAGDAAAVIRALESTARSSGASVKP